MSPGYLDKKLPKGHAYIRMRNRGHKIDIDYAEMDSAEAQRMIEAALAIFREQNNAEKEPPK